MRRWLLLLLVAAPAMLRGQAPDKPFAFDVASVKPNADAGAIPAWAMQPGGGVTITAYRLHQLIAIAYDSPSIQTRDQIVGGPDWIKSDHFDVVAKAAGAFENDETGRPTRLMAMLRSLLEDRFKLRMHSERRDAPVYELRLRNEDGRLGRRLRPSGQPDCRGPNEYALPSNATRWCGWRGFGTGHYTVQGLTMPSIARGLASEWSVGRPVVDRTGLSGRWDAQLDFVPAFVQGPNTDAGPVPNPAADSGPDILSALRDQLGLKLQRATDKIEYLVIDHVERPTPD
ncbi:MAG TPA: TIGR03435 family protein [Vicinamibacterales bacterium]|nr:TIGR03435 family protein [Vicinamibacterales bacterium]